MKILMVCLGNICRSPLAEGILRTKSIKQIPDIFIDSAGTIGMHAGQSPDHRSISVALNHGIDISKQHARQFSIEDFDHFDYIFAMDSSNRKDILSLARSNTDQQKVHLFLEYAGIEGTKDVPDPYYGGQKEFEEVYQLIDKASELAVMKITTRA